MRDATLFAALAAGYLAEFRWIKTTGEVPAPVWVPGSNRVATLSAARRAQVYVRDRGICALCHIQVDAECHEGPWACTIDHIHPLSQGGARRALANLALAHQQCNQMKGGSPHPTTIYARDRWHCRQCGAATTSRSAADYDWWWQRPIVEHQVELESPAIWSPRSAWTCHLCCHSYWNAPPGPAPVTVSSAAPSAPVRQVDPPQCPPHRWLLDVYRATGAEYERCLVCHQVRAHQPPRYERCEACRGTGMAGGVRVSYPPPCSYCSGMGRIEFPALAEDTMAGEEC